MRSKAIFYHKQGYNCAQCLLKAAEDRFQICISCQCLASCSAVNSGFGIGGMCSVLIAGIMVFGILFDDATAKRLRLALLNSFQEKHKGINCGQIKRMGVSEDCDEIIGDVADLVEELIVNEMNACS